jgi:hypothetical protein
MYEDITCLGEKVVSEKEYRSAMVAYVRVKVVCVSIQWPRW